MKRVTKSLVLAIVFLILFQSVVFAGDYVTEAIEALKTSTVYVAPGTEGTDYNTLGKLKGILNSDDNILLIMFPADAGTESDIGSIAQRLSEALGNQKIIGLAVGRDVMGYAPSLPSGVAADQMRRADSVSNDAVTALMTYAKNIHSWQAAHTEATPTPVTPTQHAKFNWVVALLMIFGFALVIVVILKVRGM